MDRTISVLKNIAPVVGDTKEFSEIAKALNPELELLWHNIGVVLNEWFLETMSEFGISRIEKSLGIKPLDTDTLEDRRFRLKARYNQDTPYTYRTLYNMLDNLCNGDFSLFLDEYKIDIKVGPGAKKQFVEVQKLVERVVPANIAIAIDILYNTYEVVKNFTHAQLMAYTHKQIRDEVMTSTYRGGL